MQKLQLSNGLNAVLLSDPDTPISSAALSIEAGSWMDGDHQGTAHFLEHMCFLGTKKYPNESEYERYIFDSNGTLNGYTANDHSLYYFSQLSPSRLNGALDRFARFFYEPLFNESCVQRERCAVDEEFRKNIESDQWRNLHVRKELADQRHPFAGFNTGNLETMKSIDRDYLLQWFQNNYSANLMNLVVVGRESPEDLRNMVDEYFAPIPNKNIQILPPQGRIFDSLANKTIWIQPIKNLKQLTVTWEIPYVYCNMLSKPASIVSELIGTECANSLLSFLKSKGLVEGLSSSHHILGGNNALFEISMTLTDKGLSNRDNVIAYVQDSIVKLEKSNLPKVTEF